LVPHVGDAAAGRAHRIVRGAVMAAKSGEQQVLDGWNWIVGHKAEFLELQRICLKIEAATRPDGRKRFHSVTCQSIYMLAEVMGIEITNDAVFRRNKSLWSTISRYLTAMHPELERVIEHRECEVARHVRAHGLPEIGGDYCYINRAA